MATLGTITIDVTPAAVEWLARLERIAVGIIPPPTTETVETWMQRNGVAPDCNTEFWFWSLKGSTSERGDGLPGYEFSSLLGGDLVGDVRRYATREDALADLAQALGVPQ